MRPTWGLPATLTHAQLFQACQVPLRWLLHCFLQHISTVGISFNTTSAIHLKTSLAPVGSLRCTKWDLMTGVVCLRGTRRRLLLPRSLAQDDALGWRKGKPLHAAPAMDRSYDLKAHLLPRWRQGLKMPTVSVQSRANAPLYGKNKGSTGFSVVVRS